MVTKLTKTDFLNPFFSGEMGGGRDGDDLDSSDDDENAGHRPGGANHNEIQNSSNGNLNGVLAVGLGGGGGISNSTGVGGAEGGKFGGESEVGH